MFKKSLFLALASLVGVISMQAKEVTSEEMADIFYKLNYNAKTPHMKVNHTKGFCVAGKFDSNKEMLQEFDLPFLKENDIQAKVRFSLGGAEMDDRNKGRGMAVKLEEPNGNTWTMVMLNSEINFAKTPEEFMQFFKMRLPVNGKVNQEKIKKELHEVASYRNFLAYMDKVGVSRSFANTPFYSVHTFWFKTKDGHLIPARWKFIPTDGIKYLSKNELKTLGQNFLEDRLSKELHTNMVGFKMYLVLANKTDKTDDTTALWKGKHKEIFVGTLKLEKYTGSDCNSDVFFPNDIPSGIEAPKDPIFQFRNETYGVTFGRRQ